VSKNKIKNIVIFSYDGVTNMIFARDNNTLSKCYPSKQEFISYPSIFRIKYLIKKYRHTTQVGRTAVFIDVFNEKLEEEK